MDNVTLSLPISREDDDLGDIVECLRELPVRLLKRTRATSQAMYFTDTAALSPLGA